VKKYTLDNVRIELRKFITKSQWEEYQSLFMASYKHKKSSRTLDYENIKNYYRFAVAMDGDRLVGFINILDYDLMINYHSSMPNHKAVFPECLFWDPNRPKNLNRACIELCWVNHQYQGLGLATQLYQFAINKMGATGIHLHEQNVIDKLDYWYNLGFKSFSFFMLGAGVPSIRLHYNDYTECEDTLYELNEFNIYIAYNSREMVPEIKKRKIIA
jgi:GNAT superfamily N-acetyltransferase